MKKKLSLLFIILLLVAQLSVPVGMIAYSKTIDDKVLENGYRHLIPIRIYSIWDYSVAFSYRSENSYTYYTNENSYCIFSETDGKAISYYAYERKPSDTSDYVKFENLLKKSSGYTLNQKIEKQIQIQNYTDNEIKAYAEVYVYKGSCTLTNLYIDDMLINDWVKEINAGNISLDDIIVKNSF